MRLVRTLVVTGMLVGAAAAVLAMHPSLAITIAAQQKPDRPPPTDEFVPIDQLPPQEQLPAAPMVVAAYSFIWIAFLVYCLSLVRRVKKLEADLATLEKGKR
jgi:CcmD family protein